MFCRILPKKKISRAFYAKRSITLPCQRRQARSGCSTMNHRFWMPIPYCMTKPVQITGLDFRDFTGKCCKACVFFAKRQCTDFLLWKRAWIRLSFCSSLSKSTSLCLINCPGFMPIPSTGNILLRESRKSGTGSKIVSWESTTSHSSEVSTSNIPFSLRYQCLK